MSQLMWARVLEYKHKADQHNIYHLDLLDKSDIEVNSNTTKVRLQQHDMANHGVIFTWSQSHTAFIDLYLVQIFIMEAHGGETWKA